MYPVRMDPRVFAVARGGNDEKCWRRFDFNIDEHPGEFRVGDGDGAVPSPKPETDSERWHAAARDYSAFYDYGGMVRAANGVAYITDYEGLTARGRPLRTVTSDHQTNELDWGRNTAVEAYVRMKLAFRELCPRWAAWWVSARPSGYASGNLCTDLFGFEAWMPVTAAIAHAVNFAVVWIILYNLWMSFYLVIGVVLLYMGLTLALSARIARRHTYLSRWSFLYYFSCLATIALPPVVDRAVKRIGAYGFDPGRPNGGSAVPFLAMPLVILALGALMGPVVAVMFAVSLVPAALWPLYMVLLTFVLRPVNTARARRRVLAFMARAEYYVPDNTCIDRDDEAALGAPVLWIRVYPALPQ